MDGVIDMEGARALVADSALWPYVRDFLWDFAPQVHQSWLDSLGVDLKGVDSSPRVKRFVLEQLGVTSCFHSFPKEDFSRLVLLDGATLESVAKWLGAIACADRLRRVTDGATVRGLKAELPEIYPEVFAFTAYFKGIDFAGKDGEFKVEDVPAVGFAFLLSISRNLPEPLQVRMRLKIPRDLYGAGEGLVSGDLPSEKAIRAAISKLFKLRFKEAYSLCC